MSGWDDVPVAGGAKASGWDAVPVAGQKATEEPVSKGIIQRLLDRSKQIDANNAKEVHEKGLFQAVLSHALDTPMPYSVGGLVRQIRQVFSDNPTAVEKYLPDPTLAGIGKGLTDVAVAPAQLAAHATGIAPKAADAAADAVQRYYGKNYMPSRTGEAIGQTLPFIATMGTSAAAQAPSVASKLGMIGKAGKVAAGIAKNGVAGAVLSAGMTPETDVASESDYWNRKQKEARLGGLVGAGAGAIPPVTDALAATGRKLAEIGKTPAPSEVLDELGAKFGGKAPGDALQAIAQDKYNNAWAKFKAALSMIPEEEAKTATVDYTPTIQTLREILGKEGEELPMALPKARREFLEGVLDDLERAMNPDDKMSASFKGATNVLKRLGSASRELARVHGDMDARESIDVVRDSLLGSMSASQPGLSEAAKNARQVFAEEVVPLFDKREGGQFLTEIRDTATPNDLLGSHNQGALTRMKPDKAAIIAKGSSADPLIYSYLDAAVKQADGKPGSFATSMNKAMPAIEKIADPETLQAIKGMVKVAKTAKWSGMLANIGISAAVTPAHAVIGPTAGLVASFNPGLTGPGLIWKLLQNPTTRRMLRFAAKIPESDRGLELIASDIAKAGGISIPKSVPVSKIPPEFTQVADDNKNIPPMAILQ